MERDPHRVRSWPGVVVAGVVLLTLARVVAGYGSCAQTVDERTHVTAGLEWIESGRFAHSIENPPLAPVTLAVVPYLLGARTEGSRVDRNAVFRTGAGYRKTLAAARLGNLLYLALGSLLVYFWARRATGELPAIGALLLFTSAPAVLGHAGLATTDMAATAMFAWGAMATADWLDRPTRRRTLHAGAALGAAFLAKFSLIPFLLGTALLGILVRSRGTRERVAPRRWIRSGAIVLLAAAGIVWAGYRVSVGPLSGPERRPHAAIDERFADGSRMHRVAYALVEAPVYPAPALFRGIHDLARHTVRGHRAFLFGSISESGWWYYYPAVLLFKTPVPLFALAGIGALLAARDARARRTVFAWLPLLGLAGVLFPAVASRIHIGVRHVLPLYPLLAVLCAHALHHALRSGRRLARPALLVPLALLAWQGFSTIAAHPRYLGWTNFLAGSEPERILVDSDLDWGQDVALVRDALEGCAPDRTYLALSSNADLGAYGLEGYRMLDDAVPASGCVVVGVSLLKLRPERYGWLERSEPQRRIGDSILLYRVSGSATDSPGSAE